MPANSKLITNSTVTSNRTSDNSPLDKAPLFKQFLKLSIKRSAPPSPPPELVPDQPKEYLHQTVLESIPLREVSHNNQLGNPAYVKNVEPLSKLVELINDARTLLQSKDPNDINAGSYTARMISYIDFSDEIFNQLTPELINPLAEVCAKLLTNEKYEQHFYKYIEFMFLPLLGLDDTTVYEKYNLDRRFLKLLHTSKAEYVTQFIMDLAVLMYDRYPERYAKSDFFLQVLISIVPKLHLYWSDEQQLEILEKIQVYIFDNLNSESLVMMDLGSQLKNQGPEFASCRALLSLWAFHQKKKVWKTWFQKLEFDEAIKFASNDNPFCQHFVAFTFKLVMDYPEKIFDCVAVAELCCKITAFQCLEFPAWDYNTPKLVVEMFRVLFSPKYIAKLHASHLPSADSGEAGSGSIPHAVEMYEYFLKTVLSMFSYSTGLDVLASSVTFSLLFMYMLENHATELERVLERQNVFEYLDSVDTENLSNLNTFEFQKYVTFALFYTLPKHREAALQSKKLDMDAVKYAVNNKHRELSSKMDEGVAIYSLSLVDIVTELNTAVSGNIEKFHLAVMLRAKKEILMDNISICD